MNAGDPFMISNKTVTLIYNPEKDSPHATAQVEPFKGGYWKPPSSNCVLKHPHQNLQFGESELYFWFYRLSVVQSEI